MLQLWFATGAPTVKMVDTPPEPNPVASDIVSIKDVPCASINDIEYDPWPPLNADAGTDILCICAASWRHQVST